MGHGLLSVVYKPVKGLLRMTLKISEGIKKTALFSFEGKHTFKHRSPIVFYGREELFRPYSESESNYMNTLKQVGGEVSYFYLIRFYSIKQQLKDEHIVLAVGHEEVLGFSLNSHRLLWKMKLEEMVSIRLINLCTLEFVGGSWQTELNATDQQVALEIKELMESLVKRTFIQL